MKKMYPVEDAGHVAVSREGLYYRFQCRVKLPANRIYRLQLCSDMDSIDLGILIPINGSYELDKKIPAKYMKDESFTFKIIDKLSKDQFIPIFENEPFSHICQIHNGCFCIRDSAPGILIRH